MNTPTIYTPEQIIEIAKSIQCGLPDGRWVAARPIGWGGMCLHKRFKAALLVFTGKAAKAQVWGAQRFSTNVSAVGAGVYSDTITIDADYLYNPENFVTAEALAEVFVDQESRVD